MKITIDHSLGIEKGVEKIKNLIPNLEKEYQDKIKDVSVIWENNKANFAFTAYGFNLKGIFKVTENTFFAEGKLPLAAMPFKSMIEQKIKEEAKKMLA